MRPKILITIEDGHIVQAVCNGNVELYVKFLDDLHPVAREISLTAMPCENLDALLGEDITHCAQTR